MRARRARARRAHREASQITIPTWLFRAMVTVLIINAFIHGVEFFYD